MQDSNYFTWNSERITYSRDYTKLATSAGACYAEKLRQLVFSPRKSIEVLRDGISQLYIDVKNLSFYLPCGFELHSSGGAVHKLFKSGTPLKASTSNISNFKARNDNWLGVSLTMNIYRRDFEDRQPILWGVLIGERIQRALGMTEVEFREKIRVQCEVNQELDFKLLLCNGHNPLHMLNDDSTKISLPTPMINLGSQKKALETSGKVNYDIAVNVVEIATMQASIEPHIVFNSEKDYSKSIKECRYGKGVTSSSGHFVISSPLPDFPISNQHTFYIQYRKPEKDKWQRIGTIPRPDLPDPDRHTYRVSLDTNGDIRLHIDDIPYWLTDEITGLKEKGCVYIADLDPQSRNIDEQRDPFSGIH